MQDPILELSQNTIKLNGRARWMEQAQRGQGLVEYALALVLVGMVGSVSMATVGPAINEVLCEAVQTLNSDLGSECTSGDAETSEEESTSSPTSILFAKYNSGKGELDVQAKAPSSCPFDLQIKIDGVSAGPMTRMGSSNVFKYTTSMGTAPTSVQVGHASCGGFSFSPVS